MRFINTHQVNECNSKIILAAEAHNQDSAPSMYQMFHDVSQEPNQPVGGYIDGKRHHYICFQNGPIKEVGTNGITHEVLLAILIDRLECYQSGKWACVNNATALEHLKLAKDALNQRTKERLDKGIEGTHTV